VAAENPPSPLPTLPQTKELKVRVTFAGNSVFGDAELAALAQPILDHEGVSLLTLERVRVAVTEHYVNRGYINSGATIPPQDLGGGTLLIQVIEGHLTGVEVTGNRWLAKRFYERPFKDLRAEPLNLGRLQQELQELRFERPLQQVNGELQPGGALGEARLNLKVKEEFPHHAGLQFRNDLPPSSGANQVDLWLQSSSLTRNADELSVQFGLYRFGQGTGDFLEADNYGVDYRIPITPWDTKFGGFVRRSTASVMEEPFNELNISSDTKSYGLVLEEPLFHSLNRDLTLTLTADHKDSSTFLFGQPYTFASDMPPGGESAVSALRVAAQYVQRSTNDIFSARVTFSTGLNVLGATWATNGFRDSRFDAVLGQVQYLRNLPGTRAQVLLQAAGQWTGDALLPVEQISIGGTHSVRGYRENTLVRDTGVYGGVEFRIPVFSGSRASWLQVVPFFDAGAGWNQNSATPTPENIYSTGLGLRFNPHPRVQGSLFWGHAFRDLVTDKNDAQDYGVHFQLNVSFF
jgi:hemolysin activation/secretion protein